MGETSEHVRLAMAAIREYVCKGKILPVPEGLPEELLVPSAAFVSLKKEGALRGCMGTIEPVCPTLAEEIISNAITAATCDPRFLPVRPWEIERLECSVDVLMPPEDVSDICMLDPKRYGVIVECGPRRGLLLPDLEGVDSVEQQIEIACRKAGIDPREPIRICRFEVKRYK